MTYVVVEDGLVREEIEFFDRAAPAASIGLVPAVTYSLGDPAPWIRTCMNPHSRSMRYR